LSIWAWVSPATGAGLVGLGDGDGVATAACVAAACAAGAATDGATDGATEGAAAGAPDVTRVGAFCAAEGVDGCVGFRVAGVDPAGAPPEGAAVRLSSREDLVSAAAVRSAWSASTRLFVGPASRLGADEATLQETPPMAASATPAAIAAVRGLIPRVLLWRPRR
jgi:hypothetical protein